MFVARSRNKEWDDLPTSFPLYTSDERDGDEWREIRKRYKREIKEAKRKTWNKFVEDADERTISMVKKYIDKPPSPYYISTINNATSNKRKADELATTFFPSPPPTQTTDIDQATYPEPVPGNPLITL